MKVKRYHRSLIQCSLSWDPTLEANVSGKLVPNATKVIAVIVSSKCTKQPNVEAKSPTKAVTKPMRKSAAENVSHPPKSPGGGTKAANVFHGKDNKWQT
uniref:Uncharacterized protein n=1 Tax=Romanomermis culicivorax TaxID=13658 RepID=A0A915JGW8_ROMCU